MRPPSPPEPSAAGVASFETAVRMADQAGVDSVRVQTRLVLAEALIHTLGGLDEAGLAALTEAERIAIAQGDVESVARARAELGYVDFLRARYDRAERLLDQVLAVDEASPSVRAKALTYLGSVASDRADYPRAVALLEDAIRASHAVGEPRREAYGRSMLGRVGLLRGDLDAADEHLRAAVELAEAEHWLSFLPWPQALLGARAPGPGRPRRAPRPASSSRSRGPARSATPAGRGSRPADWPCSPRRPATPDRAIADLIDARSRTNRLADPYVWLDVHILDALCEMGCRHGHPLTGAWVEEMHERASRAGMQELTVRAMLHGARLGSAGDAEAAVVLGGTHRQPAPIAGAGGAGVLVLVVATGSSRDAPRDRQLSTRSSTAPYSANAGGPDRRGLLTLYASAAEGIDRVVALPALIDVDPGRVHEVGRDGEVEAAVRVARRLDHLATAFEVRRPLVRIDDQVSGDDDHAHGDHAPSDRFGAPDSSGREIPRGDEFRFRAESEASWCPS